MISKEVIFNSIKYVVDNSKHVSIDRSKISDVIKLIHPKEHSSWIDDNEMKYTDEQKIIYLVLCESLNFCYWDSDVKWKIEYNGNWYSGSYGLCYAISKAIKNGHDLLNIDYLDNITIDEFDDIFKGTTTIPLLKERFEIVKTLAKELKGIPNLKELFNVKDDIELLNVIINNFSNFKDISIYKGKNIYFFKRAILLVGDLIDNVPYIKEKVKNNNNMLGCADYKIPQVLRHLGVLNYFPVLSNLVDSKKQIPHDSEEEIEIRANMLYIIELMKKEMNKEKTSINSVQIDNALWLLSKNDEFKNKPHHLTKTIYY